MGLSKIVEQLMRYKRRPYHSIDLLGCFQLRRLSSQLHTGYTTWRRLFLYKNRCHRGCSCQCHSGQDTVQPSNLLKEQNYFKNMSNSKYKCKKYNISTHTIQETNSESSDSTDRLFNSSNYCTHQTSDI